MASDRDDRHLVCVSVDGMSAEDRRHLEALPHFGRLLREGASAGQVRGIYPTQTYPLHATMITGAWPRTHGITANTRFQPGREEPDWHWYRRDIRVPTLYDAARRAGLRVGIFLWPTTGAAPVQYLLPEIEAGPGRSQAWLVLKNGTPRFLLEILLRYGRLLRGIERSHLDDFTAASAAHLIRTRRPHLLLVHLLDLDYRRHRHGASSPQALAALREEDARLGILLEAMERAGIRERTTLAVLGDHGLIDVQRRINLNAIFLREGYLERNRRGRVTAWRAWANTCEGSAQVRLRERGDGPLRRRVAGLLQALARDPGSGVQEVFGREESLAQGVGDLDFVVEARPGYYFAPHLSGQPVEEAPAGEEGGRRAAPAFHRAAHGYHPDRGYYNCLFLLAGRGVRPGARLPSAHLTDTGPTLAALLGLRLPAAEGKVLSDLLEEPR